jgi:hypothetical protein
MLKLQQLSQTYVRVTINDIQTRVENEYFLPFSCSRQRAQLVVRLIVWCQQSRFSERNENVGWGETSIAIFSCAFPFQCLAILIVATPFSQSVTLGTSGQHSILSATQFSPHFFFLSIHVCPSSASRCSDKSSILFFHLAAIPFPVKYINHFFGITNDRISKRLVLDSYLGKVNNPPGRYTIPSYVNACNR